MVAGGPRETESSAVVTEILTNLFLQLHRASQTPLPCCGGNRGRDPSDPPWWSLRASASAVPRILPELS